MKQHFIILSLLLFLLGGLSPEETAAQSLSAGPLTLLSATDTEAIIEITLDPIDALQSETVQLEGERYQRLHIPGWEQTHQPGAPQLPTVGTLIGLPSLTEVSVEVLSREDERQSSYRLPPAPTVQVQGDGFDEVLAAGAVESYEADAAIYGHDAFYPGQAVQVEYTGYLRDQAVARLQFYPVRTNPVTRELELIRRMVVRVSWDQPLAAAVTAAQAGPAFEPLLQKTVLNYGALNRAAVPYFSGGSITSAQGVEATSTTTLKIGVTEDGMYGLTYTDLTGAGFNLANLDPRRLKLQNQGVDIPIYIEGEADGRFDPSDTLLFYGTAMTGIYTTENIYWLSQDQAQGLRMSSRDGTPQGAPVPAHFPTTLHAEEDTFYWQTMPNSLAEDNWFWGGRMTAPASRSYTVSLNNISTTAASVTVRVRFKGRTSNAALNPDHHTKIYLNGLDIEPAGQWWDGLIVYDHAVSTAHSNLQEGDNTVKLQLVGDTGSSVKQAYHNWIEIDYWDRYVAEADQLHFGPPAAGPFQFEITGFSSNEIAVFDVTDPTQVARITNTQIVNSGGAYTLKFQDTAQAATRYLALTPAQWQSPAQIKADQPSAWKSPQNGADYIIISHRDFMASTAALAAHRSAAGMRVAHIDVEDLYDEFNHGIFHPKAIRDFLAYAYKQWKAPVPAYVVLVGDAYQDYKDDYHTGTMNYVPTQIVETDILGETPSDNWFVTVSGADAIPDMFVGRLSAQSSDQVETMIDKIIDYEQAAATAGWNQAVLLVADDDSPSFETMSQILSGLLPADFTAHPINAADYPPGTPAQAVVSQINAGRLLVNYSGHGSVDAWGKWQDDFILDLADITALNNPTRLPVVTVANCLNGFFSGPKSQTAVAEAFQRHNKGGAVAVWAPTGLNYPSGQRALITAFYQAIFEQQQVTLGQATTTAKLSVANQNAVWDELVETYVLFGDPALRLAVPALTTVEPDQTLYLPLIIRP